VTEHDRESKSEAIQDVLEEGVLKAVSRRDFIKGVISGGVAVSSASYLFRASSMLQGQHRLSAGRAPYHLS
jgi:hypothetical protein